MRRAVLIPVIAVVVAATACTVEVSAHTLVVHDAQENFFGDGDEPYLAVVKWRVIPGTAGSASAEFIGNLEELSGDADAGESFPVPASMGSVSFAGVQWSSTAALLQGRLPELTGTVMVAMESDLTPWGTINGIMNDVEAAVLTELRDQIEPLTVVDLTDPAVVGDALATAAANVEAAVTPGIWDSILILLGSLGNPDDLIGVGFTVWISAYGDLGAFIDASLLSALPDGATGGVWSVDLEPIDTSLTFSGDGATYEALITATLSP